MEKAKILKWVSFTIAHMEHVAVCDKLSRGVVAEAAGSWIYSTFETAWESSELRDVWIKEEVGTGKTIHMSTDI